jgi:hypothetical protein
VGWGLVTTAGAIEREGRRGTSQGGAAGVKAGPPLSCRAATLVVPGEEGACDDRWRLAKDGKPRDSLRAIDSLLKSESWKQAREDREQDRLRSLSRDRLIAPASALDGGGGLDHRPSGGADRRARAVGELSPPPEPTPPFVDD